MPNEISNPQKVTGPRAKLRLAVVAVAALCAVGPQLARAQADNWPSKPVTIVSPYNPGGTNDVPPRILAEHFQRIFGQPFIVRNAPGAAGIIGSTQVMNAAPDGYTLLATNNGAMIVQSVVKKPAPYQPLRDFTPITSVVDSVAFVGVSATLPVSNVGELITLAKRDPGKLNYSSAGVGSYGNFLGEFFNVLAGTQIMHIPGKGSAAAVNEMKAGRIDVMFDALVLPQSADGRIKTLAVVAPKRLDTHPQIPTVPEAGGPDLNLVWWFALFGPAHLPKDIVAKLEAATRAAMEDPATRKKFLDIGLPPNVQSGEAFVARIENDIKVYTDVKTRANLVVE